ncbi:MAG: hypothetical protein HS117_12080 [Verrucomicrobiaceae bacterium]|nr:hypothetical protein [Verrucomicrobiaceae bacterium]
MRPWFNHERYLRWTRRLAAYSGAQGLALLVNTLSGFLLVRGMEKEAYAWFTITNSLLATISVMSDSGLGSAMMSIGGRVCEDRPRFAALMTLAHRMRFRFMLLAALVTLPAGWWVLARNNAPWTVILPLMLLVMITATFSVESVVLGSINKLHRRVGFMVKADLGLSFSRLLAVLAGLLPGLTAAVATAATAAAQWAQVWLLRRQTAGDLKEPAQIDPAWQPEIQATVKSLFPLCLFNCVQGHITTWVLSLFASTEKVADVGALTRLGILFTFLALPMTQLVMPVIARTQEPRRLTRLSLLTLGGMTAASAALAGTGMFLASPLLWLLGPQYTHLHRELAWFLGAQALGITANVAWSLCYTRSWVRHAWWQIPLTIAAQVAAAQFLDLARISHTIVFASVSSVTGLLMAAMLAFRGLNSHRRQVAQTRTPPF